MKTLYELVTRGTALEARVEALAGQANAAIEALIAAGEDMAARAGAEDNDRRVWDAAVAAARAGRP